MPAREVTLRSLAKINLSLRVLNQRHDGFHELRTVFQTISLADTVRIRYTKSRATRLTINSDIPKNLILTAAEAVLTELKASANIEFTLTKRIPMGGGLGGGSSNAAAVLLALPVLAGKPVPLERLQGVAAALGSDVPFFLYGGTALGIGRGTELYPLPELPRLSGLLLTPGVHVSTADAYKDLSRTLTLDDSAFTMRGLQSLVWKVGESLSAGGWNCENDFEAAVFARHPELAALKAKLRKAGAKPAMMSGSGSSLFGLFAGREERDAALAKFDNAFPMSLVSRRQYRSLWWRQLRQFVDTNQWPPRDRYAR